MNKSFEVKIHQIEKHNTETVDTCERYRYKARWVGRDYIADNITCHVSAVRPYDNWCKCGEYDYGSNQYEITFNCHSTVLDACISEAEWALMDCLFGKAELLDGKYRIATVTKHADDEYTNSNLTRYGKKCKKREPKGQSVLMSIDEFDAYYDEY